MVTVGIGLFFVTVEAIGSYKAEIKNIESDIQQINQSHLPFLISSLWLTDYNLVQKQIDAIVRFPYISKAELEDDRSGNLRMSWMNITHDHMLRQ